VPPTVLSALPWLNQTRRISAASGVIALLALGFVPEGSQGDHIALLALIALGLATIATWPQLIALGRPLSPTPSRLRHPRPKQWLLVTIGLGVVVGIAVQTWFRPGTSIATGDIAPPEGIAWLGGLFEPWTWTGSSLGEPSQLPMSLPWATVLGVVHALGGDPSTAQRVWYTLLYVGVALSALGLLAALRVSPVAALVGAAVYVFNPYVVSVVNTYPVYIAAAGLLAAMPAVVIAAGAGQISVRLAALLIATAGPMVGYVFFNPPLVGMILGVTLATPLFVAWADGKESAFRSLRTISIAAPVFLAASAYWIVPALIHLSGFSGSQLADLSSWTWTESRATIRNAFWLNTIWGWTFPQYFPYAPIYEVIPISIARFFIPAMAFGALALNMGPQRFRSRRSLHRLFAGERESRITVAFATVALIVTLVSTGTNPPGNTVFSLLYNLPYGWLLREPGRFLMLVALAYAVLIAITVEVILKYESSVQFTRLRWRSLPPWRLSIVPLALATSILIGFPLYTGVVVPDSRIGLPSAHVQVPAYWEGMASVVDALPRQGTLLVMPPDDFYQMPYSWGYYGTDSFIVDLFHRPVLVPNGQGYSPASSEVMSAVNLIAQSILNHDWPQAESLVSALDAPLILVRHDINASFTGRSILNPDGLADALSSAPNFALIRKIGSLDLFELGPAPAVSGASPYFMTVHSQAPDLRLLSLLPPHAALVSSASRRGLPNLVEAPPLEDWQTNGATAVWQPDAPLGWAYRIAELDSRMVISLDRRPDFTADLAAARVTYAGSTAKNPITVSITGRTAISNGDFTQGLWGPVSDCNDQFLVQAQPLIAAQVIANGSPGGLPALQLSASLDSACEIRSLSWNGGPLVISLMTHHVQGSPPRLCLWEIGVERCASLPVIPDQSGWSEFRTAVVPDPGTTGLELFLYADALVARDRTVNEYANVRVVEQRGLPRFVLLADPMPQPTTSLQLFVAHSSYSTQWQGPTNAEHVLVDGILNGWLVPSGSPSFTPYYRVANVFRASQWTSMTVFVVIAILFPIPWVRHRFNRRRSRMLASTSRAPH
jgi:arabinofuranan 3-O-arabinosyltransferase